MSHSSTHFWLKASPLFLILFIDGMGLGLVIPVLNALILDPSSHFLATALSASMQNFIFGATIGIFMLCWFFGAALLGDLSDQIGRKKSLLICLIGSALGYLLSALAVITHSITFLIIGRVIAGFTAGSQPIAQAAIIDLSTAENKSRNIGLILFFLSLGFIVGPVLGGVLADSSLVSWFSFSTPLYFAAAISFINALLLAFLFGETYLVKNKITIKPQRAIQAFIDAFKHEKIKYLSTVFFIFILGWSSFYSFISMFALKVHHFTPTRVSLMMGVMGIGFGIGNGVLVNFFSKRFSLKSNVIASLLLGAVLTLGMVVTNNALYLWTLMIPLACCVSLAYAMLLTLFSNQVDASAQGWVMGITGAIMALVWAIDAVAVSLLATLNVFLPITITVICLTLAAGLMSKFYLPKQLEASSIVPIEAASN